ncbi:hypothetical protein SAMN05216505_11292 [Streptomyces prasinopilosus]|uniref:Uncharacterized protein n=1 Tax=Streptomyces prasinopilosus TaxID=67344 RepID=A0A1G6XV92_9ACTN|nr:hypothetical protein SAMN05216505_11292 [Streptomyces prasinopilosus]
MSVPSGIREVPENLTGPGRRWCPARRAGTQRTT